MKIKNLSFSVVVPFYNAMRTLTRCLDSLINIDYPKKSFEVILVNNSSTDSSLSIAENYPFKIITENRKNAYSARNHGIRECENEIIAFTDADCVVESQWLKMFSKSFEDDSVMGCGGEIYSYPPGNLIERYPISRGYHDNKGHLTSGLFFLPWIDTANSAYRREMFDDIGYFDDRNFEIAGDVDMSWRACLYGFKFNYVPEARVAHINRGSLGNLLGQNYQYGCSSVRIRRKYKDFSYIGTASLDKMISPPGKVNLSGGFLNRVKEISDFADIIYLGIDTLNTSVFYMGYLKEYLLPKKISDEKNENEELSPKPPDKGLVWWGDDDNLFLFDVKTHLNFRLNQTGAFMWQKLRDGLSPEEVSILMSEKWGIAPEESKEDVLEFAIVLEKEGLLEL